MSSGEGTWCPLERCGDDQHLSYLMYPNHAQTQVGSTSPSGSSRISLATGSALTERVGPLSLAHGWTKTRRVHTHTCIRSWTNTHEHNTSKEYSSAKVLHQDHQGSSLHPVPWPLPHHQGSSSPLRTGWALHHGSTARAQGSIRIPVRPGERLRGDDQTTTYTGTVEALRRRFSGPLLYPGSNTGGA